MEKVDHLIIGAGVSGLAYANFLKGGNYLVIEKENEPGGYCRTIEKEGFTWDFSGHFFHFRNKNIRDLLLKRMPKNSVVDVIKVAKIFYKNLYIDFPFQKNFDQLPPTEFFECLRDLYYAGNKKAANFKQMVIQNYGRAIADKFLIPYNEKLYACDLNKLDKDAMGRFFPQAKLEEILAHFADPVDNSYNNTFTYPKKGAIQYVNALLKDLDSKKILLGESVVKIDHKKKVVHTNKRSVQYKHLVSTIPFPKLLNIAKIKFNRSEFTYNKVLVFNLGFSGKGDRKHHWVYFPDKKLRFYRVGYYDNIIQSKRMSLYVEIGLKASEKVDIKKELSTVLRDLKKAAIITNQKLIASHHVVMDPAYVHINSRSQKSFAVKNKFLKENRIHSIGRYGGWKYCSIEDNIIEASELAKSLGTKK